MEYRKSIYIPVSRAITLRQLPRTKQLNAIRMKAVCSFRIRQVWLRTRTTDKRVPSKPEGGYECKNDNSLGLIKNAFAFVILEQRKTNFITGRSSYYPVLAGKRRSPVGKSKIQGGKGPSYAMGPGARKSEQGVMSNRCTIIGRTRLFFVPRQRSWLPTGPECKWRASACLTGWLELSAIKYLPGVLNKT
uniref:Uncharacterized protein n=1 Tax=Vespula pensylvanica TaxID=30213 RepID=A0A834P6Q9_VESPE|nr:hypothetical protein H0235_006444 [Vespula pensylvanica]